MRWFENLLGFKESAQAVRENILIQGDKLYSRISNRTFRHGHLDIPTLEQLRAQAAGLTTRGPLTVREIVADARELHTFPEVNRALVQVASQFNLLEMVNPGVSPEQGVDIYGMDHTQGPSCAIACGAGTIYRNYFVPCQGGVGQTQYRQLDCVSEFGRKLGNSNSELWTMQNGYALGKEEGLAEAAARVRQMSELEKDNVRKTLRIGIQYDTAVTIDGGRSGNIVTQAYCSAFPVGYSNVRIETWEPVAQLLLEASYEATLLAAVMNRSRGGSSEVYLTTVGGGVFGNRRGWILQSMERAFNVLRESGLSVHIVSYKQSNPDVYAMQR